MKFTAKFNTAEIKQAARVVQDFKSLAFVTSRLGDGLINGMMDRLGIPNPEAIEGHLAPDEDPPPVSDLLSVVAFESLLAETVGLTTEERGAMQTWFHCNRDTGVTLAMFYRAVAGHLVQRPAEEPDPLSITVGDFQLALIRGRGLGVQTPEFKKVGDLLHRPIEFDEKTRILTPSELMALLEVISKHNLEETNS